MKRQFAILMAVICAILTNKASAQNWLTSGNAGTNPSTQFIGTSDNKAFKIRTNNTVRLMVKSNGDIGIGTQSPISKLHVAGTITANAGTFTDEVRVGGTDGATGYKLAVNGKAIAEEMRVELKGSWPDYVFEEHYDLMSLELLQNEIIKNKHLPGIPSAAEMSAAGGIDLGAMQLLMVEKVEELTLYILQLKSQNDDLRKQNAQLQERVSILEHAK